MKGLKTPIAIAIAIATLIIGYIAGIFTSSTIFTPSTTTLTITVTSAPTAAATTAQEKTVTVTQTVTISQGGAGLSGEIPIGALLPLTGALATYGQMCQEAFLLAVNDVNEWLKALGKPWRLKPIVEDTAVNPQQALDKLMALHAQGVKVVVGPMASSEVLAIKSYADSNQILVISQSSTAMSLAIPGDFIYRFTAPDSYQAKAIAHIMWLRGIRFVVPIWRGDAWGDGLADYTKREFENICRASGEACGWDSGIRFDPNAKEFSTEVATLASKVQSYADRYGKDKVGVLVISFEEAASIITEALKYPILSEVLWQGSDGTYGTTKFIEEPSIAEFVIKTQFWNTMTAPGESPLRERVRSYIMQKLGSEPIPYAYFTYDAVWAIALAIDHTGSYDGAALRNAIPYVLQYFIGSSGHFVLDENGDRATADYVIGTVAKTSDGKYVWKDIAIFTSAGELKQL
ncbi:Extracellular ligand-binding receptor [Ignisphaera aggregans DSM 17230]|uniref:Extracellular ligand-binding receptor n=1 Tax=Ignisphaera aggregans (strain DSM 17230 / JCM 13409 / AQ1.S1) TaxID=583356 RepID=E0SS87_IGNAA|nr:Extracellular ligand-binding receptor [Ignisphaera aggregans DSM 17230]